MSVLDGFEPMELPREKRKTKWNTHETLDAFIDRLLKGDER